MPDYEYKTVALPRSVAKRRRRRQSEADLVAEQLGKVLNEEARDRWEYVRAETLTTPGQRGLMKQARLRNEPATASVAEAHAPDVRFGTASVQLVSDGGPSPAAPRPPVGTAQD
jgi:hypothetical protein